MEADRETRVLLVDSDLRFAERMLSWSMSLDRGCVKVLHRERLGDAIRLLSRGAALRSDGQIRLDAIVLNLSMPDCGGPDGLARLQESAPDVPLVVLTTPLTEHHTDTVLRMGVADCLRKDQVDLRTLIPSLVRAAGPAPASHAPGSNRSASPATTASYECEPDGQILRFGPDACRMYGYDASRIVGTPWAQLRPAPASDEAVDAIRRVGAGEALRGVRAARKHRDGHEFEVVASVFPRFDADGEVVAIAFVERLIEVEMPVGEGEVAVAPMESVVGDDDRPLLLVVEDHDVTRHMLAQILASRYRVVTASDSRQALLLATRNSLDGLILDMSLGEQRTGLEVLEAIRGVRRYAHVPAVACTAYALPGLSDRLIACGFTAYINKPFTRQALLDTVERALLESDPEAPPDDRVESEPQELVLPPMPASLADIVEMLADPEGTDIERLARVLERDPVVASWVLHHVNSAFYSVRGKVSSIDRAVMLLGFEPVCNLVLTRVLAKAFSQFEEGRPALVYEHLQRTGVATAAYARALSVHLGLPMPDLSFTAGLLHQLGRLGLLSAEPDRYSALWFTESNHPTPPSIGHELIQFGVDHVALGIEIARSWNLPPVLTFVIQRQHEPSAAAGTPEALIALTVAVGTAATDRLYAADSAVTLRGPQNPLTALAKHRSVEAAELDAFLMAQDDDVRELVGRMVQA